MPLIPPEYCFRLFISNIESAVHPDNGPLFMRSIFKVFKTRLKKGNENKQSFPALIVFCDDILALVIIGKGRITGAYFIQLLLFGPQVGIYFVMASHASYLNLLKQLMCVHPMVKKRLEKNNIVIQIPPDKTLGAELILSGEGLLFFRQGHETEYKKLYP